MESVPPPFTFMGVGMIRQEVRRFSSRDRFNGEMFPAPMLLTWVRFAGVWMLVGMEIAP